MNGLIAGASNNDLTRRSVLTLTGAALIARSRTALADPAQPVVHTSKGAVVGLSDGGVCVFKGLRYGQTTRATRFRAPRPAPVLATPVVAQQFGPACPQTLAEEAVSEDCLFLNIWTPEARRGGHRPVLVYIHGGEYSHGSGSSPLYDGALLAQEQDVVVLTLNHRLGILGHLALNRIDMGERARAGNAGLLDLILALNWVRDEIAAFGGDPACVTLFGQSGGGAKIASLMAMPAAHGLFHRAVTMSGQQVTASGPLAAERRARAVLEHLNIAPDNLAALDQHPVEALIEASLTLDPTLGGPVYFGPVVDGVDLPRHPFFPDAAPASLSIPMIIGGTRDEVRIFFRDEWDRISAYGWDQMTTRLARELRLDCDPRQVTALYRRLRPFATPEEVFYAAITDSRSWRGGVMEAQARAQAGAPAFVYQVNFESPLSQGRLKACHMIDIPLMFGTTATPGALCGNGEDARSLSRRLRDMLGRFARTGNPDGPGLPDWPPYELDRRSTLALETTPRLINDPRAEERRFFAAYPFIQRGTI